MVIPVNERWISVPKNKQGEEDCDYGDFETENVLNFDIPDEEFQTLLKNGALAEMNDSCDLLIQDYETETIPFEKIGKCMSIIRDKGDFKNGAFMDAFRNALNLGTFAQLEF